MSEKLLKEWGKVCINGKLVAAEEATVSAIDRGFLYGDGIFETIRVYKGVPFMLDAHLARMAEGCSVISMPPPNMEQVKLWVEETLSANCLSDAYLRITATRGATGLLWYDLDTSSVTVVIMAKPMVQERFSEGLRLMVSSFRSDELSPLSRIKHTGILWKIMARAEARRAGVDDALLLNTKGHVSEATAANIFWVCDGKLFTPALDCGILAGITRAIVIEIANAVGIETQEGYFTLDDVFNAEEVFLTSSTRELVPVRSLGDKQFGDMGYGRMTKLLLSLYQERLPS